MKEISLFVSICWSSSRTRILYFEKRDVDLFCWGVKPFQSALVAKHIDKFIMQQA